MVRSINITVRDIVLGSVGIGGELGQGRKDDLPPSRVGVDGRVDGLRRCRRQGVGDAGIRGADVGWW